MSNLEKEIEKTLTKQMYIPKPLKKLFAWIEKKGYIKEHEGTTYGYLYDVDKINESWQNDTREGGTFISFYPEKESDQWYLINNKQMENRLRIFGKSGDDGSVVAFWLNDKAEQKIVHIGSGSGSTLACILAHDPIDFLRLLAIGYDEICWEENLPLTAKESFEENKFYVQENQEFTKWLKQQFQTTIPKKALEIIKHPALFDDEESQDEFWQWLAKNEE